MPDLLLPPEAVAFLLEADFLPTPDPLRFRTRDGWDILARIYDARPDHVLYTFAYPGGKRPIRGGTSPERFIRDITRLLERFDYPLQRILRLKRLHALLP